MNFAKLIAKSADGDCSSKADFMSPEAERVWRASEEYIAIALAYLRPKDERYSEGNALWRSEECRVSFLFPNWPERSRQDLCKVRCRFLGVGEAQRAEREQSRKEPLQARSIRRQMPSRFKKTRRKPAPDSAESNRKSCERSSSCNAEPEEEHLLPWRFCARSHPPGGVSNPSKKRRGGYLRLR